jgi:hypothetical protein
MNEPQKICLVALPVMFALAPICRALTVRAGVEAALSPSRSRLADWGA